MSKESGADIHQRELEARIFAAELGDPLEIDLHGKDRLDCEREADLFLHQAFMAGEDTVRIIHGRGSGTLRETIHGLLQNHELVEHFRDSSSPGEMMGVTYAVLTKRS